MSSVCMGALDNAAPASSAGRLAIRGRKHWHGTWLATFRRSSGYATAPGLSCPRFSAHVDAKRLSQARKRARGTRWQAPNEFGYGSIGHDPNRTLLPALHGHISEASKDQQR